MIKPGQFFGIFLYHLYLNSSFPLNIGMFCMVFQTVHMPRKGSPRATFGMCARSRDYWPLHYKNQFCDSHWIWSIALEGSIAETFLDQKSKNCLYSFPFLTLTHLHVECSSTLTYIVLHWHSSNLHPNILEHPTPPSQFFSILALTQPVPLIYIRRKRHDLASSSDWAPRSAPWKSYKT